MKTSKTEMYTMVLQSADHLQPGAVAHMRQPRIAMPAKIALQNAAIAGAIEQGAPGLEFPHTRRSLFGVELRHPPVVQILTSALCVSKVNAPAVAIVHIGHGRGYSTLGHHGMGFAEKRFRNDCDLYTGGRGLDGGPQTGAPGSNDQNVVLMRDVLTH
jgi:hypothetical protein